MIKRLLPAIALLVLCTFAAPRPVLAYDFFQGANCSDTTNGNNRSAACADQPGKDVNGNVQDPLVGSNGILAKITDIVAIVAGMAAVIIVIVSGLKLVTSGSDVSTGSRTDTDIEDARRSLANAVIGLVVIVAARTLIVYVLNRI
jgi:hypothetical protein